ncbi:MAG: LCP family protein, partial [Oscillospiraceae bacterium]
MKSNATQRRFLYSWWMIPLSVLLLLVLVSAGAWAYFQGKLDRINFVGDADPLTDAAEQTGSLSDLEYLNVLLLGTDERTPGGSSTDFSADLLTEARSDACMVLNLNLKQHTAALVSLERAIGVSIEGHGQDWLTHVFAYGGANLMLKTVREQLGVDVRRYLRVNVSAAAQLIDAIGGVDLTLTKMEAAALNGEVYTNAVAHTRVKEGLNHLDGFDTMAYARQ